MTYIQNTHHFRGLHTYIPLTLYSRKGNRDISDIWETHILPKRLSDEKYCRRDRWLAHRRLITVHLKCAVNLLVAFYDIYGSKRELLFFSVPDTTRDIIITLVRIR
jgi:hypothetical protein